jgi:hypothetical protein
MLRKLFGEKTADLMADGFRGRPDSDLSGYAAERGLAFRGQSGAAGYFGAFSFAKELQWNMMRGILPGGRTGVLLHHVAILDPDDAGGQFYGKRTEKVGGIDAADFIPLSDIFSPNIKFFRLPETRVAIRLPASVATLRGFHVARRGERSRGSSKSDVLVQRGLGLDAWRMLADDRCDLDLLERVVRGPLGDALSRSDQLGFSVEYKFGQLIVTCQDFLHDPAELDAFASTACSIADGIEDVDPPGPLPASFDAALPEPEWLGFVAEHLDERNVDAGSGAWLEPLVRYAGQKGMRVEDPVAFHRAFASLPLPGMAFGGASAPGIRIATACEQRIRDVDHYKPEWPDAGLTIGCDMVLQPTSAANTQPGDGEVHEGLRYAVREGVLLVSAMRDRWQFDEAGMDALVTGSKALAQTLG